jgi:hypothetical protein
MMTVERDGTSYPNAHALVFNLLPPAPPSWAQPYADLSKQFRSELVALNRACPG